MNLFLLIWSSVSCFFSLLVVLTFALNPRLRTVTLTKVFWMSICDLGYSLVWVVTQSSPASWDEPNSVLCQVGGTIRTLFYQGIIGWYFLISISLFSILAPAAGGCCGRFTKPVKLTTRAQHLYVWSVAILCAGVPLPFDGYASRDTKPGTYTCILASEWRAMNAIPLIYTMAFSFFLLIYAEARLSHIVLSFGDFKLVFRRLLWFVGVFVVLFAPALVDVIWGLVVSPQNPPDMLLMTRLSCVMITSLFNFAVWASRPAFFKILFARCRHRAKQALVNHDNDGDHHDEEAGSRSQVIDTIHNHSYARLGLAKKDQREEVHYHAEFLQGEGILDGSGASHYGTSSHSGHVHQHHASSIPTGLVPSDSNGMMGGGGSYLVAAPGGMSYAEPLVFSMPNSSAIPRRTTAVNSAPVIHSTSSNNFGAVGGGSSNALVSSNSGANISSGVSVTTPLISSPLASAAIDNHSEL